MRHWILVKLLLRGNETLRHMAPCTGIYPPLIWGPHWDEGSTLPAQEKVDRHLNIRISSISDQNKSSPVHFWNLNLVSRLKPDFQTRMSGWNNESLGENQCMKPVWWDWYFGGSPKFQIVGSREFEGNWLICILIAILYLLENTGPEALPGLVLFHLSS